MSEAEGLATDAYILHSRSYRENSVIVQLFTLQAGLFDAVVRGYKKGQMILQPFNRLEVFWRGKAELKTLVEYNLLERTSLSGTGLYCGMYLNELLTRLLHKHEPMPEIFSLYAVALDSLGSTTEMERYEVVLRNFELSLVEEMGYGLALDYVTEENVPVQPAARYQFVFNRGIVEYFGHEESRRIQLYSGQDLVAIQNRDFSRRETRQAAKQLMREMLAHYLGSRPLKSRELFTRIS